MNLTEKIIENYQNIPEKIGLIQGTEAISYKELYYRIAKFKKYLKKQGIKKGNKIIDLVPMSIEL